MKAEQGGAVDVPDAPAGTPLASWLTEYWRAWWTLTHDRPQVAGGMEPAKPGRIPWRDLVLWCDMHPHMDIDLLMATVDAMDGVYLAHWMAEAKKAAARARRESAKGRRGGR